MRQFARQCGERRLRRGISNTGEGVNSRTDDGGNIDDRALRRLQLRQERAGKQRCRDEIDIEHPRPDIRRRIHHAKAASAFALRRNSGIVDKCRKLSFRQA